MCSNTGAPAALAFLGNPASWSTGAPLGGVRTGVRTRQPAQRRALPSREGSLPVLLRRALWAPYSGSLSFVGGGGSHSSVRLLTAGPCESHGLSSHQSAAGSSLGGNSLKPSACSCLRQAQTHAGASNQPVTPLASSELARWDGQAAPMDASKWWDTHPRPHVLHPATGLLTSGSQLASHSHLKCIARSLVWPIIMTSLN